MNKKRFDRKSILIEINIRKCGFSELLTHTHDRIAVLTYTSTYTLLRTHSGEYLSLLYSEFDSQSLLFLYLMIRLKQERVI
jgi:hypothetical protein